MHKLDTSDVELIRTNLRIGAIIGETIFGANNGEIKSGANNGETISGAIIGETIFRAKIGEINSFNRNRSCHLCSKSQNIGKERTE